jgi:hypothetical protein
LFKTEKKPIKHNTKMPGPSMDSIKKKIMSMVNEKDQAVERADQFEQRAAELEEAIKSVCLLTN